jgi:hypothetical protein
MHTTFDAVVKLQSLVNNDNATHKDCSRANLMFLDILWARASAGGYSQWRALRLRIAYQIQENPRNWGGGGGLVAWLKEKQHENFYLLIYSINRTNLDP